MKRKGLALLLALCLMTTAALAETISFNGNVEASTTAQVYAPIGGTVEETLVKEGQSVTADSTIARVKTNKVYAPEDGTITSVFGGAGEDATAVVERYGGVMYLEGQYTMTIAATTGKAYEAVENYIVHSGETVYLVAAKRTTYRGKGVITGVDGNSFTVLVTEGRFFIGDAIDIMRDSAYTLVSRIGRGNIARVSPTAIGGEGTIVSTAVQAGDTVKKGQLLFETVDATYDGAEITSPEIKAGVDGIIASLQVSQGASVTQSSVVAEIYPKNAVWVVADVAEADLQDLSLGQKVKVELDWNQDQGVSYEGTVDLISALGTIGEESTTYPVYISFTPDENTRYGMTAVVTTLEEDEIKAAPVSTPEPEAEETEAEGEA
ncbi:MAG: HlyD family efflux transporter periplasmic adaptor subunit [Clostridia bacterium]|nr:HlyD family efflux transporter periplasmic adaptor subunit [Clostridia bacterium]